MLRKNLDVFVDLHIALVQSPNTGLWYIVSLQSSSHTQRDDADDDDDELVGYLIEILG